jgi:hypothetical protein
MNTTRAGDVWRDEKQAFHTSSAPTDFRMFARCISPCETSPPRIDDRRAGALMIARVAGRDPQPVAQRRRRDDQIGLRERMRRLARLLFDLKDTDLEGRESRRSRLISAGLASQRLVWYKGCERSSE